MNEITLETEPASTPWHLWFVGVLALLWNASGAWTIMAAQLGALPDIPADEIAYYAAQPAWFVAITDVALVGAILAALMLLLRNRWAVPLFAVSLAAILFTDGFDLLAGTSRMMNNSMTVGVTVTIWLLAVFQLWYAAAMRARGVLR